MIRDLPPKDNYYAAAMEETDWKVASSDIPNAPLLSRSVRDLSTCKDNAVEATTTVSVEEGDYASLEFDSSGNLSLVSPLSLSCLSFVLHWVDWS